MNTTFLKRGAIGAASLLCLAACGGQQSVSGSTQAPQSAASSAAGQSGQGSNRRPGVSGLIAAVQGTTMQVQSSSAQTAVSWTDQTTFSKQVAASLADVKPGVCVVVRSGTSGSTARSTARASAQPSAAATPVEATAVTVSEPVNGSCSGGYGNASRTASPTASGTRTPRASASGGYTGSYGGGAQGVVKSVSGGDFVVTEQRGSQSADVTIDTTGATTYSKTASASASDVKTGECATAMGKTDDTGAVAATSIALSDATNGACRNG